MAYPFEVSPEVLETELDVHVATIFSLLQSEFLILPKGDGFVDYPSFEEGYEALKKATAEFQTLTPEAVFKAIGENPIAMIVIRTMLGFTPPEWAYVTTQKIGVEIGQGFIRNLDRTIRMKKLNFSRASHLLRSRVSALIETACSLLHTPVPQVEPNRLHRLDKADTREGVISIRSLARLGAPYAMLLYERFFGRPFAGHRDSVSELVGDSLESAIEDVLIKAGVSYRKTKRAERIPGFGQAPDFIIPSEFNPQVVIEAKLTEDDGTARDKVTRIQHLAELSQSAPSRPPRFQVVARIGGRGFGVRREDMKKLLLATKGKVLTLRTLDKLVALTKIPEFKSSP